MTNHLRYVYPASMFVVVARVPLELQVLVVCRLRWPVRPMHLRTGWATHRPTAVFPISTIQKSTLVRTPADYRKQRKVRRSATIETVYIRVT